MKFNMYKYSKRSEKKLLTCNSDLIKLFRKVIKLIDITILDGHRSEERQNRLYKTGKSKKEYPNSKHNVYPSEAIDVAPYPIDWNDLYRFYYMAGIIKACANESSIGIRWGGDWDSDNDFNDQQLMDLVHFELTNPIKE